KLDRASLPPPEAGERPIEAPGTPIEEAVAATVGELLGVERVGADDDFFSLGGNSLVAAQLAARIGEVLGVGLGVRDVFDEPTVAGLARRATETAGAARPPLVARERPQRIPLSPAQQRIWFINQFDTASPAYNISISVRLSGELDVPALLGAVADVVARHESLRTIYPLDDRGPRQEIRPIGSVDAAVEVVDVDDEGDLRRRVRALMSEGFDVTERIPLRAGLFRASGTEHILTIVLHHILADGFSLTPLARDLALAYTARLGTGPPAWPALDVQYADYTLWQTDWLGDVADRDSPAARQLSYWTEALAGLPEVLELPTDHPRPDVRSERGDRVEFEVPAELHKRIVRLARERGASVFMVVHAGLAVLLSRLAGSSDIAVGTPIAGRGSAALDDMVGMFVNTLVLRCDVSGSSFAGLLDRVRDADLGAFMHADVPFERVVEAVDPPRSTSHSPLFQVLLEFRTVTHPQLDLPGLQVQPLERVDVAAGFDLQLSVAEEFDDDGAPAGMSAGLVYATDLFEAESVRRFADRFIRILETATASPDTLVADADILDPAEQAALHPVRGDPVLAPRTLADLLAAAARMDPGRPAIRYAGADVTYDELDRDSNLLARRMIGKGIGPGSVVALGMARCPELLMGLWAVAKAGAAFMPVDPAHPPDRIELMLGDSGAALGLTVEASSSSFPDRIPWWVLDGNHDDTGISDRPIRDDELTAPQHPDHVAYLIYTSGSTGIPKGVAVTHRGIANFAADLHERCRTTPESRILQVTSPSFDVSVLELLLAVGVGATMVIAPPDVYGGEELRELLASERVTHCIMTPTALAMTPTTPTTPSADDPGGLDHLGCVLAAGEALPPEVADRWATDRTMLNAYGPTETTVIGTTSLALVPGTAVSIGG
ncbi:MAG: condensation domain-containing protein, partial [Nocardiaceae bacterium]|nr:condensation domain-containing protein [Nocardiaceae bacterium]